jgi:uncharacterized repeat protein (TIGR01451 family)
MTISRALHSFRGLTLATVLACGLVVGAAGVTAAPVAVAASGQDHTAFTAQSCGTGTTVADCPNLTIAVSPDASEISVGDDARYTVVVTNSGPGAATGVHVDEALPGGVDWSVSLAEPIPAASSCSSSISSDGSQSVSCDFPTLADGASVTILVSGATDEEDCGSLHDEVAVSAANEDPAELDDNGASADISVLCPAVRPDLVLEKVADRDVVDVTAGEDTTVGWSLTYELSGGPVTNAVLSDPIPDGLEYVPGSASDGATYDAVSRTLTWTFARLSAGGEASFETTITAAIGGGATLDNVATIDSDQTTPDKGEDEVRTVEQEQEGSTGRPKPDDRPAADTPPAAPAVPNTATTGPGDDDHPADILLELVLAAVVASMACLFLVNVGRARLHP